MYHAKLLILDPMSSYIGAVSYTHLDVYKRQENIIIDDLQLDTNDNEMMTIPADPNIRNYSYTIAVSYTHLDVYKRQGKWYQ